MTLAESPAISGLGSCPSERTVQKNMIDERLEPQEWAFPDSTASCQRSRETSTLPSAVCLLGRTWEPTSEPCSRSVGRSLVPTTGLPLTGIVILSNTWTLYLHYLMGCSQQPKEGSMISPMS